MIVKWKFNHKNHFVVVVSIFIISMSVILILKVMNHSKLTIQDSSTLPGATEINPSVMYNENIYYWESLAGPSDKLPQGVLPDGYEYVGEIKYTSNKKLTQDFQFVAKFKATGQLYYNKNKPDYVYICITTYWLENAYVKFSK